MPSLREIVEETDTWAGKTFDLTIQTLILYSLATFAIETLPSLSSQAQSFLRISETAVVGVFTLE